MLARHRFSLALLLHQPSFGCFQFALELLNGSLPLRCAFFQTSKVIAKGGKLSGGADVGGKGS
jgi:hypothetical protein